MLSLRARWSKLCLAVAVAPCCCTRVRFPHRAPAAASRAALPILRAPSCRRKVTATNEATGISRDAQTNESGDYVFPRVRSAPTR